MTEITMSLRAMIDGLQADAERAFEALKQKRRLQGDHMTGCTSYVQRTCQIGYNRAMVIMAFLEQAGLITPADGTGARRLLTGSDTSGG